MASSGDCSEDDGSISYGDYSEDDDCRNSISSGDYSEDDGFSGCMSCGDYSEDDGFSGSISSDDCSEDDGSISSSDFSEDPPPSKKQEVSEVEGLQDDYISQLPDALLVQILSLLPTTEEAYATCVLSKGWQHLWTSVYNFYFSHFRGKSKRFLSFVDYVLAHSVASKIKKFEIHCSRLFKYKSQIGRWLRFAVDKNVEDVIIYSDPHVCILPESFFTCSSLITLHLVESCLVSDIVIAWKSLTSIKLEDMVVVDAEIMNILSGCPSLETIVFHKVGGFRRLEIKSSKVKSLALEGYWLDEGYWPDDDGSGSNRSFEIFAPYLQHLELSQDFYDFRCRLVDVSSLVDAKITFDIKCFKEFQDNPDQDSDDDEEEDDSCRDFHQGFKTLVQDYLQKLRCATKLTIGTWFTEVLCILQFKEVPIPDLKCKYLELELHLEKFNLYGAAGLLRASPLVETVIIDVENQPFNDFRCRFEFGYLEKGDNIDLQRYISSFVFPNLKKVKIVISPGMCLEDHLEWEYIRKLFQLSKFLLKNALVLEKFVIVSSRRRCEICYTKCVSRYLSRLAKKLSNCPRSSANSVIIFQE
ncbi:putative F-box protein At1g49610 [Nicotiana tomentosiformis]|uniref:putative F-box protein At1g49610 n=1 Tax=Nicotiana tomentosiformis TaxID=4098 RepID=UPI00051B3C5C|nr:putative F-box/LRR-repeat protein At5g02930 isoform X1 [Nicotiana tomentosiformis]